MQYLKEQQYKNLFEEHAHKDARRKQKTALAPRVPLHRNPNYNTSGREWLRRDHRRLFFLSLLILSRFLSGPLQPVPRPPCRLSSSSSSRAVCLCVLNSWMKCLMLHCQMSQVLNPCEEINWLSLKQEVRRQEPWHMVRIG